ncbi:hypothetical protein QEG98_40875 [Myxococcus sp. MxC21-1]|nr:hypothetical protein QEG98_40875 [Myxococcus sp. MxC21-1]
MRDASPLPSQALAMTQWQSNHDRAGFESTVGATVRRFLDQGWFAELITLARSEGNGRPLHTELVFGLERVARRLGEETQDALNVLRQRASANFAALLPDLLEADASVLRFSVVNEYLYRCRQDLLTPYLDAPVITGRFAKGEGLADGVRVPWFHRWTPEQSVIYVRAVRRLMEQPDLNTWTVLWCVTTLAALDWAPKEALFALVDDARPVVREKAIRVLARCDQGEGLPTLLRCLEAVEARLTASRSAEARRVAVWCLVRDAGPKRGWTPERLVWLVRFQQDASPLVAGAALPRSRSPRAADAWPLAHPGTRRSHSRTGAGAIGRGATWTCGTSESSCCRRWGSSPWPVPAPPALPSPSPRTRSSACLARWSPGMTVTSRPCAPPSRRASCGCAAAHPTTASSTARGRSPSPSCGPPWSACTRGFART